MAQYWWQPDPSDLGLAPSNWTNRYGTSVLEVRQDANSDYYLHISGSRSPSVSTLDSINGVDLGGVGDCEFYGSYYAEYSSSDCRALLRYDPALGDGRGGGKYRTDANLVAIDNQSDTTEATASEFTGYPQQYLKQRVQAIGTAHKARVWLASDPEQSNWDIEVTSSVSASQTGYPGQYRYREEGFRVYGIGIGTNGDPAPRGPLSQHFWTPPANEVGSPPSNITIERGNVAATVRDSGSETYVEFASTGSFAQWRAEVSELSGVPTDQLVDFEVVKEVTQILSTDLYVAGRAIMLPDRNSVGGGIELYGNDGSALQTYDVGGGWKYLDSPSQPAPGDRYYLRLRVIGTSARMKWWLKGDPEPANWLLETDDYFRNDMQPGDLVFYGYVNREWHLFSMGLGLNGAEAPLSDPSAGPTTPINLGVTNLQATSVRLTWQDG